MVARFAVFLCPFVKVSQFFTILRNENLRKNQPEELPSPLPLRKNPGKAGIQDIQSMQPFK